MGKSIAVEPQEELVIEEPVVAEDASLELDAEDAEDAAEVLENEIVLEGDEGSQPDKQSGIRKRINKLNARNEEAAERASDAEGQLAHEREKTKLLQMALDQKNGNTATPSTPPDKDDFDDHAQYVKALTNYQAPLIQAEVQRQASKALQQQQNDSANVNLMKMQTKHYERAEELSISDFEETEDKAIAVLGKSITNELIKSSDNSHLVLYHLGKNPSKAESISELVKTNPVKAALELGALGAKLSVKPKAKTEPTPDPDEELQGGTPASSRSNTHQRRYEKAISSGNMKAVIAVRKAAKESGVTIIR